MQVIGFEPGFTGYREDLEIDDDNELGRAYETNKATQCKTKRRKTGKEFSRI